MHRRLFIDLDNRAALLQFDRPAAEKPFYFAKRYVVKLKNVIKIFEARVFGDQSFTSDTKISKCQLWKARTFPIYCQYALSGASSSIRR